MLIYTAVNAEDGSMSVRPWHYCDIDGRQASFLCPNGTVFSQAVASCDWWFNVHCAQSPKLYLLNARLYRRRRPAQKPRPAPHRVIDKQLIDEIFLK
ncbi:hypothetical protein EVAR_3028_1 [Eumeta japonica]|uniref:Chitin-binding type-2 domain-containing protein n=1 Tax=Eumeta variegata TaxID=151549 RepID=A0A4C1SW46_EUMVA|nr:hypothetical protein EVAR_3028_1 [Eumeta japonica]